MFKEKGESKDMLRAWCAVIETFIYEWANFKPMVPWILEMERALSDGLSIPNEIDGHVACSMFMGLMYSQPQHPKMTYWAERVWQIVSNSQDMQLCVKIVPHLVLYYSWWHTELSKAEIILNALRPHIDREAVPPLVRITWYVMSAIFYWMMAETKECIAAADKGLALAKETACISGICSSVRKASLPHYLMMTLTAQSPIFIKWKRFLSRAVHWTKTGTTI